MRYTIAIKIILILIFCMVQPAIAADVTIKNRTKFYSISGTTAHEFALSMSKKGPYSFQHRRRAWATAARELSFQLIRNKSRKGCTVKKAKVTLKVTYTMPKLSRTHGISRREHSKWRRMYALLNKHEKRHGALYHQFARKVHKALQRLPREKSCRRLERAAMREVKRLSAEDSKRNDEFDRRDGRNYKIMARIYTQG